MLEAMTGLCFIIGPIIVSALYGAFGFKQTFFVYGGFKVILAIVIRISIPDRNFHSFVSEEAYPVEQLIERTRRQDS